MAKNVRKQRYSTTSRRPHTMATAEGQCQGGTPILLGVGGFVLAMVAFFLFDMGGTLAPPEHAEQV